MAAPACGSCFRKAFRHRGIPQLLRRSRRDDMAHDILIVDDEDDIRELIAGILDDEGYDTRQAASSAEAFAAIAARQPSLIILDVWLRESAHDGLQMLEMIRKDYPSQQIIMISGHGTIETAVQAIRSGAYDFIEKPFAPSRLATPRRPRDILRGRPAPPTARTKGAQL